MGYGAVPTSDDAARDAESNFQESDMLYVKERKLSQEEKCRKWTSCVVPLIVAIVLVTLFASFVSRALHPIDKGEFSPRQHPVSIGDYEESSTPQQSRGPKISKQTAMSSSTSSTPSDTLSTTDEESSTESKTAGKSADPLKGGDSAACSAHETCMDLELTGYCCPTSQGVFLGCCK